MLQRNKATLMRAEESQVGNTLYYQMVRTIIVAVLLIAAAKSVQISSNQSQLNAKIVPFYLPYNLGFPDFQGSCVTTDMKSKIIQIINQAAQYEGDSVQNNLRYIKQQIDIRFGSLSSDFYVHIQIKNQSGFFNVLTSDKCTILGLRPGVNTLQPQWSYLIFKSQKARSNFFYEDGTGKGSGVSPDQMYVFTHIIEKIQPQSPCDCASTPDIWKAFYKNDGKNWNIICAKSYSNRMFIAAMSNQYATVAFNCVYNIYAGYSSP